MSFDPESAKLADQALLERRSRPSASATASVSERWTAEGQIDPAQARESALEDRRRVELTAPARR